MTDKLISDLAPIGAAIADNTATEVQRNGQITTEQALASDWKTYIQSWLTKAMVGLGNVPNTDTTTQANVAFTGLSAAAAAADADIFPTNQGGGNLKQTLGAIKTWIKSWIAKADVGLGNVANSLQLVAASNLSDVADVPTARGSLKLGFGSLVDRFYAFTDCFTTASYVGFTDGPFIENFSGTGATTTVVTAPTGTFGVLSLDLGTTTTGRCSIASLATSAGSNIRFGAGQASFQCKAAIHTLSNGTDTYTTRLGFIDNMTAESADGAFFRYTDGVNSGKWQAVTRTNGTETATDTGVTPVADTFQKFKIVVNAAGTSCVFSIDGSVVATNITNIPTAVGHETGFGVMSLKSAGTTATSGGYIDFIEVEYLFTSSR